MIRENSRSRSVRRVATARCVKNTEICAIGDSGRSESASMDLTSRVSNPPGSRAAPVGTWGCPASSRFGVSRAAGFPSLRPGISEENVYLRRSQCCVMEIKPALVCLSTTIDSEANARRSKTSPPRCRVVSTADAASWPSEGSRCPAAELVAGAFGRRGRRLGGRCGRSLLRRRLARRAPVPQPENGQLLLVRISERCLQGDDT